MTTTIGGNPDGGRPEAKASEREISRELMSPAFGDLRRTILARPQRLSRESPSTGSPSENKWRGASTWVELWEPKLAEVRLGPPDPGLLSQTRLVEGSPRKTRAPGPKGTLRSITGKARHLPLLGSELSRPWLGDAPKNSLCLLAKWELSVKPHSLAIEVIERLVWWRSQ